MSKAFFTNIPVIESINLVVDYIMEGNPDIKLGRENLTKLFFFANAQTHFSFLGNFYDQIHGVAMGSPFAPVLANLFMGHHEKGWLENYNSVIEFYRRYVDDTFAWFNTEQDALSFFSYINSQHPNIYIINIGETNRHLATRIREHLASDKSSHIFKHLRGSENCRSLCSEDCFKILDSASTSLQLKIKDAMHILWDGLNLSLPY